MTVITVEVLEKAKKAVEAGLTCGSVSIDKEGFTVTPEAIEWLKKNHYQLKVAESFGPTEITIMIFPASAAE